MRLGDRTVKLPTLKRVNLSGQFLVFSLAILLAGMISIGLWIQLQIEEVVTHRTAEVTTLYVNSIMAPRIEGIDLNSHLSPADLEAFDQLLAETALGRDIVSFKLWSVDGAILYSHHADLIGLRFNHPELERAIAGDVVSKVSNLSNPDNIFERSRWETLIETYAPVQLEDGGPIVAVAEFYQDPTHLVAEIGRVQNRSWLFVGAATLIMYLLLVTRVRYISSTIESQRAELQGNVERLGDLLATNQRLRDRMQAAAGRTTALNERYLHRLSADLHDGPAQDLALALLKLEAVDAALEGRQAVEERPNGLGSLGVVRSSLDSALRDIRAIAGGLRLPEIGNLSLTDTTLRVIKDFERATGKKVEFHHDGLPDRVSLSMKITVYRVLQEALANSFKHGNGASQVVVMTANGSTLDLEITDDGPGFDLDAALVDGSLGLVGMRERVELLGGSFKVAGRSPTGTAIRVCLSLTGDRDANE